MSSIPTSSQNKVGPRHVKSMMSVKMCISGSVISASVKPLCLLVLIFFISYPTRTSSSCSSVYGATPCTFLPAPPGHTPPCAKPGLTYCEYPDQYPGERIKHLIQKWRYDHTTLLIDESQDEFSAYFYPLPDYNYKNLRGNFGSYGPPLPNHHHGYYPEPIYIPKPQFPIDVNFYNQRNFYSLPNSNNYTGGFAGYRDARTHFKYTNDIPPLQLPPYQAARLQTGSFPPYSNNFAPLEAWNREDNFIGYNPRLRRATLIKTKLKTYNQKPKNSTSISPKRTKRQAALAGETLCQSTTRYIMPRAALNNKGNWMFVVNMPELDNRYTQLVKSETCRSQVCSGLCQLPTGYSSRCEQKYIQKRLVALEGGGNDLYTDVFWIPSCCVCTISNQ